MSDEARRRLLQAIDSAEPASAVTDLARALRLEGMGQVAMYRLFLEQQQRLSGEGPRYAAVVDAMDLIWGGGWAKPGALFDEELNDDRLRREQRHVASMSEDLSASVATYSFYKYGACSLGAGFIVVAGLAVGAPFFVLAFLLFVPVLVFLYGTQFKRVALLDNCLVISDGKRSCHVPLNKVLRISQGWGASAPITLVLKEPSLFGRRVLFIPPGPQIMFPLWEDQPIVQRLRALSREHWDRPCAHKL